jgi:hypothetical protein
MNVTFYQKRLRKIRGRNEVSVAIRRGSSTLTAQAMRIEYAGSRGFRVQSDAARAATQAVFILGEPDMDIQAEDRLTYQSKLIKVVFIQVERQFATIAEGVVEE